MCAFIWSLLPVSFTFDDALRYSFAYLVSSSWDIGKIDFLNPVAKFASDLIDWVITQPLEAYLLIILRKFVSFLELSSVSEFKLSFYCVFGSSLPTFFIDANILLYLVLSLLAMNGISALKLFSLIPEFWDIDET